MVKQTKKDKLTRADKRAIKEQYLQTMGERHLLTQELEITLDLMNQTGYPKIPNPMFWFLILMTSMRICRENLPEEMFFELAEMEAHTANNDYLDNQVEIDKNKERIN